MLCLLQRLVSAKVIIIMTYPNPLDTRICFNVYKTPVLRQRTLTYALQTFKEPRVSTEKVGVACQVKYIIYCVSSSKIVCLSNRV